ncbi:MAG TPA: hypothetical protein VGK93_07855 [Candidatus Eisenbacteria bacterium]|jgi:hypothetical protein
MHVPRIVSRVALVSAALTASAIKADATTLIRQGLDQLASDNELVLQGRVLETHSYWNDDHTFILTNVRVRPSQILKGSHDGDVTFTLMGGTVGEITTLIVGGADLWPGSDYVLFLSRVDLPGAADRLTVRDHAQGVFDLENGRAFSQALGHALLPGPGGRADVPGGEEGLVLEDLVRQVRAQTNR